jgi:DNA-binding CsgD family transcriptional regulator
MPKIITNKEIIYDALINIKLYNLSYTQICKIFKIDRKTAYNYLKNGIQNIINQYLEKNLLI